MNYVLNEILSLVILIPGIISVARFRATDSSYFPFLLLIWIGGVNEIISIVLINRGLETGINNNIYVLLESLLILWFLRRQRTTLSNTSFFGAILISYILFWGAENFIYSKITYISSYFRIYYSFVTVLLSINTVNHIFFLEKRSLLRSPLFLIGICFISFFTYKILVEVFWLYGLNNSDRFRKNVYDILLYLNLVVNLAYILAALWIPRKKEFIPLS